jgi:hypothetical protein
MSETGGTSTQSGIHYQNSIASLYIGRLLDSRPRTAGERVIEVRVEAPTHVDDIVVRHGDGSRSFIQAKESLSLSSQAWGKLWDDFTAQAQECLTEQYRLILAIGTISHDIDLLRELCERAKGKQNHDEWLDSLSKALKNIKEKITNSSEPQNDKALFNLLRFVEVWIWPLDTIERDIVALWIPPSSTSSDTLFDLLRGKVGGKARIRGVFHTAQLLDELSTNNKIRIHDVPGWGIDAYLQSIRTEMGILTVPGTKLRGPIDDLFFWMPLHDRANDAAHLDFEDEDPRWRWDRTSKAIDMRDFPRGTINRAVIDAGAGFGKTTMLHAIATRLCSGVRIPVLISLDALAASSLTILGYLNDKINTEYDVSIDWERLCEGGRVVVLLDGLDELSAADRTGVLNKVNKFAARFQRSAFLLTVRDSAALTVPLGVPVLAINRLDDFTIRQFAKAYARYGSSLSADVLSGHLQRHPDLSHLLRIPLFLALVLATVGPGDNLPGSRSELLEHYLSLLFSPERYKAIAKQLLPLDDLREASEFLAWRGLEADGIGVAEVEARRLLRGQGLKEQPDTYIERLLQIGVLQRAGARLRFAYPIVQEYLAACWMVANVPKEIGPRFASITHRPWAQALQFALEMHPDAETIIKNQLDVPDDAFNTSLRLIARCIVNGANISTELKSSVGVRLADAWPSEAYSIRNSIGYLLADGFLNPLPTKAVEHISNWALHSGGAEIVTAISSTMLTQKILKCQLEQDHILNPYLHGWQAAVDEIADEAIEIYIERVRQTTNEKDLEYLYSLIAALPPSRLSPNRWHQIADDPTMPSIIRMAGYALASNPLPPSAWSVIDDVIMSYEQNEISHHGHWVFEFYWRMPDAEARFVQLLNDASVPEKRIKSILEGLLKNIIGTDTKRAILQRTIKVSTCSDRIHFLMLICLAIWGDEEAERDTIPMLSDQDFDNLTAWFYHANKFGEATVCSAADVLSARTFGSKQLFQLISTANFGLSYKMQVFSFDMAVGEELCIHPARAEMLNRLSVHVRDDDVSIEALKFRAESGDTRAVERLISEVRNLVTGFEESMPFDDDQTIDAIIYLVRQKTSLPQDLLFQIVDKSASNAGRSAVDWIVRSGDEKVIIQLLERYNSRAHDFVREAIFVGLETLAGRYGKRIARDSEKLKIE